MIVLASTTEAVVDLTRTMVSMSNAVSYLLNLAVYVLMSLGLYTIAKRRGIHKPWMAWIPVGNMWILGCIADQYRHVALQQEKNRRRTLLVLNLITVGLTAVMIIMVLVAAGNVLDRAPSVTLTNEQMTEIQNLQGDAQSEAYLKLMVESLTSDPELVDYVFAQIAGIGVVALIISVVYIAATVVQYIALYDLFASCDPANKMVYLLIGILFNVAFSVLVFLCRKKDLGMPARGNSRIVEQMQ